jgi:hypothetical protein
MGRVRPNRLVAAAGVAAVVWLGLVVVQSGVAAGPVLSVGAPFALGSGVPAGSGVGPSALGPDGTIWAAVPTSDDDRVQGRGFVIVARAVDGQTLAPVIVSASADSIASSPAISASAGAATFVWETQRDPYGSSGVVAVTARRCTLAGCAAIQTLASWRWGNDNQNPAPFPTGVGPGAEPAVASVAGRTVVVFWRESVRDPQMVWAQSSSGRFGSLHSLGAGSLEPILVGGSGGRLFAVWLDADAYFDEAYVVPVHWARWSTSTGFTRPRSFIGGEGVPGNEFVSLTGLVGTPVGSTPAIAWVQEDANTARGPHVNRIMVARQSLNGFAKPVVAYQKVASALSLASGDGVLALAFNASSGIEVDGGGPMMVQTSIHGAPFGRAVELDSNAAPFPSVSVTTDGHVLAGWGSLQFQPSGEVIFAELAIAPAGGAFSPPTTLGPQAGVESPTVHTNDAQAFAVWQSSTRDLLGAEVTP